jgi:hypothetical protein
MGKSHGKVIVGAFGSPEIASGQNRRNRYTSVVRMDVGDVAAKRR